MQKFYTVDICGVKSDLPILPISDTLSIAFFNLHGAQALTEHCAKHVAKLIEGADVILTAESKDCSLLIASLEYWITIFTPLQGNPKSSICRTA